ncbi:MAG: alpha/beta hydrolase [Pseudomonadota bacterium]|nr:alpha/beta hydrolase [Pseudomonadota bacterium]
MAKFDRSIISPAEMEWHFNPRVTVPDRTIYMTHRNYANDRVLKNLARIPDLRYGPNPGESLDIYPAKSGAAPVLVYIHGGYWRAGYKEDWAFVAGPLVDCGATVVVLNYDLCPTISLDDLVSEIRRAMIWIFHNIGKHGGNPHQMFISGSSAGAHLCAMMLGQKWWEEGLPRELIRGAVLITGIYDVLPVLDISVNEDIRLDSMAAERNSPMRLPPQISGPLLAAVGANEAEGWKQQTRDYVAMCETNNIKCDFLELPDQDHFSLGTVLGDSDNPLVRTMLGQMGLI